MFKPNGKEVRKAVEKGLRFGFKNWIGAYRVNEVRVFSDGKARAYCQKLFGRGAKWSWIDCEKIQSEGVIDD